MSIRKPCPERQHAKVVGMDIVNWPPFSMGWNYRPIAICILLVIP